MRTTSIALSLIVGACAPIGQPGHHGGDDGPDAGVVEATCDTMATKTMDVTYTGTAIDGMPSTCWKLNGKLTISGAVTSLDKLGDLREVSDLEINGGNLTTFDAAIKVTRSINIHDTTKLVDLGKLVVAADPTCLSYISSVSVVANSALTDLKGLQQVMCVAGATTIQNNVNLVTINLDSARRLEGGLTVQDNTKLRTLSFNNVESITHDLVIRHNIALDNINSMAALHFMHGSVIIDDNDALVSLAVMFPTGFPNIEGQLSITGNAKLNDLGQVAHVPQVFSTIRIDTNDQLQYCAARAVGCCVQHTGTAAVDGIGTGNCNSWCYQAHGCYATN